LAFNKSRLRLYIHSVDDEDLPLIGISKYFYGIAMLTFLVYAATLAIAHTLWEEDDLAHSVMIAAFEDADPFKGEYNLSPTSKLNALQFARYGTVFLWVTCCICGLGGELVFGQFVVRNISDESGKALYHLAQLFFSLALAVALFSHSPFSLPFVVLGLWKVGFPETTGCFLRARRLGIFTSTKHVLEATRHFLNGIGTVLHHTAAAYVVCACVTHLCPVNRITLATCMPIVMQHWFVLVRYHHMYIYGFIELCLEILFEWEIFANLPNINNKSGYDGTIRAGALTMVVAHWCFWAAALVGLIDGDSHEKRNRISFNNIDKAKTGAINKKELLEALNQLLHRDMEDELDEIFDGLDIDGDGLVSRSDFEEALSGALGDELADHDIIEWRKTAQDFRKTANQRLSKRLHAAVLRSPIINRQSRAAPTVEPAAHSQPSNVSSGTRKVSSELFFQESSNATATLPRRALETPPEAI